MYFETQAEQNADLHQENDISPHIFGLLSVRVEGERAVGDSPVTRCHGLNRFMYSMAETVLSLSRILYT